jgi:hypothetical protein
MKNLKATFTTFDIVRILSVKRVTLQAWLNAEFIKPAFKSEAGRGPGKKSYFNRFQLYLIRLFQVLISNGIARKDAAKWIQILDKDERSKKSTKAKENEENFITVFRGKDIDGEWLPGYLKTSYEPLDLEHYRLPTVVIGRVKYEGLKPQDYDFALTINFAKVKKAVDFAINE